MKHQKMETKETTPEQAPPVEIPTTPEELAEIKANIVAAASKTPIVDAIYTWLVSLPQLKALLPQLEKGTKSIVDEQDGFVRNGNRTDYKRDILAFTSSKVEHVAEGFVLNYSTMKGRRVDEIIYTALMHIATAVYPATERADKKNDGSSKINTRKADREKWVKALGFDQTVVGSGKRWAVTVPLPGVDALRERIALLAPEKFDGTEQSIPTRVQVAFKLHAGLGAETVYKPLLDPQHDKVSVADVETTLNWLKLVFAEGWNFKYDDTRGPNRVQLAYLDKLGLLAPVGTDALNEADPAPANEAAAAA